MKESGVRELNLPIQCENCEEGRIIYKNAQLTAKYNNLPLNCFFTSNGRDIIEICRKCNGDYKLKELELEKK